MDRPRISASRWPRSARWPGRRLCCADAPSPSGRSGLVVRAGHREHPAAVEVDQGAAYDSVRGERHQAGALSARPSLVELGAVKPGHRGHHPRLVGSVLAGGPLAELRHHELLVLGERQRLPPGCGRPLIDRPNDRRPPRSSTPSVRRRPRPRAWRRCGSTWRNRRAGRRTSAASSARSRPGPAWPA